MDFIDISSIILTICVTLIASSKRSEKDLKLSLNPVELLDLIIEEQMKQNTAPAKHHKCKLKFDKHLLDTEEMEITTIKNCHDEDALKTRKIWSRWSKWTHCSVSCGEGTISRIKLCVAGRCAPGEREEQHRPCNRAPCAVFVNTTPDISEELLDFEQ